MCQLDEQITCSSVRLRSELPAVSKAVETGAVAATGLEDVARADLVFVCVSGEAETRSVFSVRAVCVIMPVREQLSLIALRQPSKSIVKLPMRCARWAVNLLMRPSHAGVPNAADGTLSITVGAAPEVFERVAPWLGYMGSDVAYCGPVGTGTVMKLMNNMVLFENVSALAEAMAIAARAGVDRSQVFELLGQGSADSFALRRHGAFMTSGEYPDDRFPTSYSAKDLDYALALANDLGVDAAGRAPSSSSLR